MDQSINEIIWVHGDALSPTSVPFQLYPNRPALFVFDDDLLTEYNISLKRILFMYECLLEMPVTIRRGDVALELSKFAQGHKLRRIVTVNTPAPRFKAICRRLQKYGFTLEILDPPPFVDSDVQFDLKRFSRYWRKAQKFVT